MQTITPLLRFDLDWRDLLPVGLLVAAVNFLASMGPPFLLWNATFAQIFNYASWLALGQIVVLSGGLVVFWAVCRRWPYTPHDPWQRSVARVVGVALACGLLGVLRGAVFRWAHADPSGVAEPSSLWNDMVSVTSYGLFLMIALDYMVRSRMAQLTLQQTQITALSQEREAMRAQSQLLQAQVEPHFIFNALANVRRLMHIDAAAAKALLGDLLHYLEAALPSLRSEQSSLGQEMELVRAFLAIHQVRMGKRLAASVTLPSELAAEPIPAMALLTLVENALKHGLSSLVEGGQIHVIAEREAGTVCVRVIDTGKGMGSGLGSGTGLANVQARIKALHGAGAQLSLGLNEPRGVVATLRWSAA